MSDLLHPEEISIHTSHSALKRLKQRKRRAAVFRGMGIGAVLMAVFLLILLMQSIIANGYTAFYQYHLHLNVHFDAADLDPETTRDRDVLRAANYRGIIQKGLSQRLPQAETDADRQALVALVSASGAANKARQLIYRDMSLVGQTLKLYVPTSDDVDQLLKGRLDRAGYQERQKLSDRQLALLDELVDSGDISARFNWTFFTGTDSADPELAGIASALTGSLLALLVAFLVAMPIGIGAAIYLEEFAAKNFLTEIVELNINNLAAVPSIIFGLLGLAVFLNIFGMPRSTPLVGGFVLALMTLPAIIIATRAALKAVPASIQEAAFSLGASRMQMVVHHKLPLAGPAILTGAIMGMARALGEAAPLLMIGMVAFIAEAPANVIEPASALPVQIFLWADHAEGAWVERASAAILVMLVVLLSMNALAVFLRSRLEKKW